MLRFSHGSTFVYVSAAEDGVIEGYLLDEQTGALKTLGATKAGQLVMPMTLNPNEPVLYAVVRSEPLRVLSYEIDHATGALIEKTSAPLADSMAYASTDRTGRVLFTSSYGGDKIAMNPIGADGLVRSPAIQVIPTGKNAHSILADRSNRFVYATKLGSDQVLQFRFDPKTGKLIPNNPALIKVEPDNGPRHIAISPDNKYVYILCELSGNVIQFAIDQESGNLTPLAYVGTIPADSGLAAGSAREALAVNATSGANTTASADDKRPKIWAADLQITPNGKFMYTTERTKSHIALLSIAPGTGKLTYIKNYETETQPRGIKLDPAGKYLVASGEKSDRISTYRINQASGELSLIGRAPVGHDANWVEIVTFH